MTAFSELWNLDVRFNPKIKKSKANDLYKGWKKAVSSVF